MSNSEQCSNRLQLDQILILVNLSCELGQIMTIYDVIDARCMILSNVWINSNLTWFTFGKLFIWIWANNDQLWLPRGQMNDLEQCLNWLLVTFFVARKSILNTELSGREASCFNFMFSLPLKIPWTFFSIMISLRFGTHGMFLQNNNWGLTVLIVWVSGQHIFGTRVRYWGIFFSFLF